jgi:hypothetical protein
MLLSLETRVVDPDPDLARIGTFGQVGPEPRPDPTFLYIKMCRICVNFYFWIRPILHLFFDILLTCLRSLAADLWCQLKIFHLVLTGSIDLEQDPDPGSWMTWKAGSCSRAQMCKSVTEPRNRLRQARNRFLGSISGLKIRPLIWTKAFRIHNTAGNPTATAQTMGLNKPATS